MKSPEIWLKNKRTLFLEKQNTKAACDRGFTSDRKLLVIESDDWGSIRVPSKEVHGEMLGLDPRTVTHPFFMNDGLAGEEDLEALYEVLRRFKDSRGHHPVITANCAMANPDFAAIEKSGFGEYSYEIFTDTLKNTKGCEHSFELWKQGMEDGLFYPQLHCREHFNVNRWMKALQSGDEWLRMAFAHGMISTASCKCVENENTYMDAFNYDSEEEQQQLSAILQDAGAIFERTFGYESKSFIASCYIWGTELEDTMRDMGIRYIQGEPKQRIPSRTQGTAGMGELRHYMGDTNTNGQVYLIRNANFEPSFNPAKDWVDIAMNSIDIAFERKMPAVVCSHRLNYIGRINESNRVNNLRMLEELLVRVTRKWKDVEFVTSEELGRIIEGK